MYKPPYNVFMSRIDTSQLTYIEIPVPQLLPSIVDMRNDLSPIDDQGSLGSSAAISLCELTEYLSGIKSSSLFLYYNQRKLENNINDNIEASIYDTVKYLIKYGSCSDMEWPYIVEKANERPPVNCYTNALTHKIHKVYNIKSTISDIKTAIYYNVPLCVGIKIFSSFESEDVIKYGIVPMPKETDTILGGQAVLCVGYDDTHQVWIMRNSFGTSWGDKGYFYLHYDYLLNHNYSTDIWCILKSELNINPELINQIKPYSQNFNVIETESKKEVINKKTQNTSQLELKSSVFKDFLTKNTN